MAKVNEFKFVVYTLCHFSCCHLSLDGIFKFPHSLFIDTASGENVTESLVSEGLATVRREGIRQGPEQQRLIELEDAAKAAGKGKWASTGSQVIELSFIIPGFPVFIVIFFSIGLGHKYKTLLCVVLN